MKGFLIVALLGLLAWSNRDRIPLEYQFWRHAETLITIQNNSDQDIKDVVVIVWSTPHELGSIPKGKVEDLRLLRIRDSTEVVVRFRYGAELIERHAGTLTEDTGYRMAVTVYYAGVVMAQIGNPGQTLP
jgi:hypothetical protein